MTAESFSGGAISLAITKIAGASRYFSKGFICYSPDSKTSELNVDDKIISSFGIVSQPVIKQMLSGLIGLGADVAIASTGNAGPSVQNDKVGICYVGAACKSKMIIKKLYLSGNRIEVMDKGATAAIECAIQLLENN